MFYGSMPALITPFNNDKIDEKALINLIEFQIKEGSSALVISGTTGETPTLVRKENERIIEICIEVTDGRVPVIAGAGANSTHEALIFTDHVQRAGADAILSVVPYYNKPTQKGLKHHFLTIADATDLPIILYDIPGRSVVQLANETIAELAEHKNIIGLKDTTCDMTRPITLASMINKDFCLLSGEDPTTLPFLAAGGHGSISVTANIAPKLCAEVHKFWQERNYDKAFELHKKLLPLHQAMFCSTSPGPVKYGASLLGICTQDLRSPLVEIDEEHKNIVKKCMQDLELI